MKIRRKSIEEIVAIPKYSPLLQCWTWHTPVERIGEDVFKYHYEPTDDEARVKWREVYGEEYESDT